MLRVRRHGLFEELEKPPVDAAGTEELEEPLFRHALIEQVNERSLLPRFERRGAVLDHVAPGRWVA